MNGDPSLAEVLAEGQETWIGQQLEEVVYSSYGCVTSQTQGQQKLTLPSSRHVFIFTISTPLSPCTPHTLLSSVLEITSNVTSPIGYDRTSRCG